ncbi:replication factor A protein 3 [Phakopsora pachyrhizi]|uniref:Replication factor A protein 3 n=1 Tax=Phakopsora pachyrhizi TaxID=170000 RepID=A0AAV0AHB1_PHAPC|nr:replication factor A protein 3 [Phakopsora pachyrhizi]CAH7667151.1 replication factor A protein 3 [Phakopsora pachyrhizi]
MDAPTPRVSSQMLGNYIGKVVRITGKVVSISNDIVIESSDGGQVIVKNCDGGKINSSFVEMIAKVESSNQIREMDCFNLGDNYDLKLAQAVIDIIHNPGLRSERAQPFPL